MIILDRIFGENAVAKIRKVECRAKRTGFFFYAETQYLRYAVAKIRKKLFDFIVIKDFYAYFCRAKFLKQEYYCISDVLSAQ